MKRIRYRPLTVVHKILSKPDVDTAETWCNRTFPINKVLHAWEKQLPECKVCLQVYKIDETFEFKRPPIEATKPYDRSYR